MNEHPNLYERIAEQTLPRWNELPDLELYMDQVLSLIERYLRGYHGFDRKGLTASMVNNYVKLGVMPPPIKKKYTRIHLAYLVMICVLKTSLPMDSIKNLISESLKSEDCSALYNEFCEEFETSVKKSIESALGDLELRKIYQTALRAQAEQALALKLYEASFGQDVKIE